MYKHNFHGQCLEKYPFPLYARQTIEKVRITVLIPMFLELSIWIQREMRRKVNWLPHSFQEADLWILISLQTA